MTKRKADGTLILNTPLTPNMEERNQGRINGIFFAQQGLSKISQKQMLAEGKSVDYIFGYINGYEEYLAPQSNPSNSLKDEFIAPNTAPIVTPTPLTTSVHSSGLFTQPLRNTPPHPLKDLGKLSPPVLPYTPTTSTPTSHLKLRDDTNGPLNFKKANKEYFRGKEIGKTGCIKKPH